jgi:predicted porin
MKKHLIALAVAGAVAAPAFAQNVSIYGTVAGGYTSTKTSTATTSTNNNEDNLSSTIWGIKGSEDLGGGMKANFVLANEFKTGDGVTATSGVVWTESFVGLTLPKVGTVSFGRQGSVYDSYKSFGNVGANFFSTTDQYLDDLGDKFDSTVKVSGVKVGPVTLHASVSQRAGASDVNSAAADFAVGPVAVSIATAQTNLAESESTLNLSYKATSNVTLLGQYMKGKEDGKADQKVLKFGVKYTMGAIDILGSMQSYKDAGGATREEDAKGVVGVYNLSKRTALFAGYNNRTVNSADTQTMTIGAQHKF